MAIEPFEQCYGFTDVSDISDLKADPLLDQLVGYSASFGLPGTDGGTEFREGLIWTRPPAVGALEKISEFITPTPLQSQCLSVNGPTAAELVGGVAQYAQEVRGSKFVANGGGTSGEPVLFQRLDSLCY